MATIVEMINPLTGLPEQVDQLDHTAQEIDDAVDLAPQLSNPNLLDNWYFGNPVNQRGQTSYTGAGYGIDRWYLNLSSSTAGGIQILDDCIQFIANGGTHIIEQRIEGLEDISGKTVTLSVLIDTFGLVSVTTALGSIKYKYFNGSIASDGYMSVEQLSSGIVSIVIGSNGTTRKVYAAKLELGTHQTLAHQDENGNWVLNEIPDYGEQLARCQRYYLKLKYNRLAGYSYNNLAHFTIPTPVTMRTAPTIKSDEPCYCYTSSQFIKIDGLVSLNGSVSGNSVIFDMNIVDNVQGCKVLQADSLELYADL